MSQAERKKKGRIVIIIGLIGITIIAYTAISYQVEHSHRTSSMAQRPKLQVVDSVGAQGSGSSNARAEDQVPSLPAGAQLPSEIPAAMLKAMEARGMSVDELRGGGKGTAATGMGEMGGTGNGQFPDAMQKALAERNASGQGASGQGMGTQVAQSAQTQGMGTQGTPQGMRIEATNTNAFPAFISRGVKHIENHRNNEEIAAINKYLNAISRNPNDVQSLVNASNLFLKHNEVQSAKYLLQRATVAAPSDPSVAYFYGSVLAKDFNSEEAAKQWERSLSIQDNAQIRFDLARLYRYQLNQAELAKKYLEQALTIPNVDSSLKGEIQRELDRS